MLPNLRGFKFKNDLCGLFEIPQHKRHGQKKQNEGEYTGRPGKEKLFRTAEEDKGQKGTCSPQSH